MKDRFHYIIDQFEKPIKRYCLALDLIEDEDLIKQYRKLHSSDSHWKEIRNGIREVGILKMDIYIYGNHLFMLVDVDVDFNWDESFARLATLPRQEEWEKLVSRFQKCDPDASSAEKWTPIERIFTLYD